MEEIKNVNDVDVESRYQHKTDIEHILSRSDVYLGSMINELIQAPLYYPSKNMIISSANVAHNGGLLKLIGEVLANSVDEYRRSKAAKKSSLFDISKIKVLVNTDGHVEIYDNGGIPIKMHKGFNKYVPEMIFGHLRTSSNYDDENTEREGVGRNGLGVKLTNIFSKSFQVDTADGVNRFIGDWSNNMSEYVQQPIVKSSDHYTKVLFDLDLERFDTDEIPASTIRLIQKQCIDIAAVNHGLEVEFESNVADGILNSRWKFDSFKDYVQLYVENELTDYTEWKRGKDNVIILYGAGLEDVGFVNGVMCNAGSHITKVQQQIVNKILALCEKNDMPLITNKDILSRFTVFVDTTIINPKYDSQAKTKLATNIPDLQLKLDSKFLDSLADSELYNSIVEYYKIKYKEQIKKDLRKINNLIKSTKSNKLIPPGIRDKDKNDLLLFEGDSAASGFRKSRTSYQAAYILRGKVPNTYGMKQSEIVENKEWREILAASGLLFGNPDHNLKNSTFSNFIFFTDMDYDGDHIAALLLCFFVTHFPELVKAGRVYRGLSPIIIASKGSGKNKETRYYYSLNDYYKDEHQLTGWDINYTKGLGGLTDDDYNELLRNQKLIQFTYQDIEDLKSIAVWFDTNTDERKSLLLSGEEMY